MNRLDQVLKRVAKKITPSKSEQNRLFSLISKVEKITDNIIKPLGFEKTISGSTIRDTWLSDKKEFDLFILFPESCSRRVLEQKGLELGKEIMKRLGGSYEIAYAEHPYIRGKFGEFSIDIVPCYRVKSASCIKSAVDRTPFHNEYIKNNLKPAMSTDVRLLKQFCKSLDIYGSDLRTCGFSGYLCELLIIYYGSFKNLVRRAGKWKPVVFIDIERHCTVRDPRVYFKDQPLVVIDPTDPKRNVAASLSPDNFVKFVKACELFVKNPDESFFEKREQPIKLSELEGHLKEHGTNLILIKFHRPKGIVDDILWPQMRKTARRIKKLLESHEFEVLDSYVWADEKFGYIIVEMKKWELPEKRRLVGPPIGSDTHVREFLKRWRDSKTYVENGRWIAEVERRYRNAKSLLDEFFKKTEKELIGEGVRSHIAKGVSKGFKILDIKGVEKLIKTNRGFSVFIRKCLKRDIIQNNS